MNTDKEAQRQVAVDAVQEGKAVRFYSGREGCCCGCRGTYHEASDAAVNKRWSKKFVALLTNAAVEALDFAHDYAAVTVGERLYIVYWS